MLARGPWKDLDSCGSLVYSIATDKCLKHFTSGKTGKKKSWYCALLWSETILKNDE
jgi:hypothetical protein